MLAGTSMPRATTTSGCRPSTGPSSAPSRAVSPAASCPSQRDTLGARARSLCRTRDRDPRPPPPPPRRPARPLLHPPPPDRKSTRLNSRHVRISYAVFCLKKKNHILRALDVFILDCELDFINVFNRLRHVMIVVCCKIQGLRRKAGVVFESFLRLVSFLRL